MAAKNERECRLISECLLLTEINLLPQLKEWSEISQEWNEWKMIEFSSWIGLNCFWMMAAGMNYEWNSLMNGNWISKEKKDCRKAY